MEFSSLVCSSESVSFCVFISSSNAVEPRLKSFDDCFGNLIVSVIEESFIVLDESSDFFKAISEISMFSPLLLEFDPEFFTDFPDKFSSANLQGKRFVFSALLN